MIQINPYNPRIKEFFKYLGWILLFFVLWFKGCCGSTVKETLTVAIPEIKGNFEANKPVHEPVVSKKEITEKGETIYKENPIDKELLAENEKLKSDFAKASDSIKQLSFNKAIELNKFSSKFEDDYLVLNIDGVVRGEVQEVTPSYTIKERKMDIPVKQKETVFRLLGGLEVGNNIKLDNFNVKGNLMFQNRKGNILSGSFDTQQNIWVGYNFSIFNIKK